MTKKETEFFCESCGEDNPCYLRWERSLDQEQPSLCPFGRDDDTVKWLKVLTKEDFNPGR